MITKNAGSNIIITTQPLEPLFTDLITDLVAVTPMPPATTEMFPQGTKSHVMGHYPHGSIPAIQGTRTRTQPPYRRVPLRDPPPGNPHHSTSSQKSNKKAVRLTLMTRTQFNGARTNPLSHPLAPGATPTINPPSILNTLVTPAETHGHP